MRLDTSEERISELKDQDRRKYPECNTDRQKIRKYETEMQRCEGWSKKI